MRDLNDLAIVVGTRITGDVQDGRFYLAWTSISLTDAVSDDDAAEFGLTRPTGINDSAWVVGYEEDGTGWLLEAPRRLRTLGIPAHPMYRIGWPARRTVGELQSTRSTAT